MADSLMPDTPSPRNSKSVLSYMLLIAAVAGMGGLLFGYDIGVISGALLFITSLFHLTPAMEGFVTGSVLIGAIIGAIGAGPYAERFGRRNGNFLSGAVFASGAILTALVPDGQTAMLVTGRIIVGIGVGANSVVAPMYIAEVAPPKYRGALVSLYQLAITIGIFVSYLVDTSLDDVTGGWRWMFGLAAIPAVLLMIGMTRLPRSPRWLVQRGLEEEAEAVLLRTIAAESVGEELEQIRRDTIDVKEAGWGDVFSMPVLFALIVGVGLMFIQQLCGINTIIYYAPIIFKTAGYESNTAALIATTSVGLVNMLATLIAIWLVDKWGRKPLLLLGLTGMILSLIVLGAAFLWHADHSASEVVAATKQVTSANVATHGSATPGTVSHAAKVQAAIDAQAGITDASAMLGWITIACLMTYITCFAFSLGPIAWLMLSEIFPNAVRGRAVAVATAANWIGNFIVAQTFLLLLDGLGAPVTFWIYAGVGVLSIVFIAKLVPETKGRTLEEIERDWLRKGEPASE